MQPTEQATQCYDQMAIVEKYERIIAYLYPIAQSMPRKHGVAREMFLQCLLGVPGLLFQAGKSNQISKIYTVDAGLAQLFANVYGNPADRFIHFDLKQREWARYMDDIVVLGNDKDELMDCFLKLSDYSINELELQIGKWQVSPVSHGINFLGYRIWPTHKLLRKDSVTRAKRKISRYVESGDDESLRKFAASWQGHARWADSNNLFKWMESKHGISFQ